MATKSQILHSNFPIVPGSATLDHLTYSAWVTSLTLSQDIVV